MLTDAARKQPTIGTWTQGNGTPRIPGYFLAYPCYSSLAWKNQTAINSSSLHPKIEKPIRISTENISSGVLVTIAIFFYGHLALLISGEESS
jgi:hypothetical protein